MSLVTHIPNVRITLMIAALLQGMCLCLLDRLSVETAYSMTQHSVALISAMEAEYYAVCKATERKLFICLLCC